MKFGFRTALSAVVALAGLTIFTAAPPASAAGRTEGGYWMVTQDGHIYGFGGATKLGESVAQTVPRVDVEPTPSGNGYWILGSNGSINEFGDAHWLGSGTVTTLAPGESFVSMSATPDGEGYWLFTSRGRVLSFGDATSFGDLTSMALNAAILGSVATPTGQGYWMVASDGGIFSFGDARFFGSMGDRKLNRPVISMAPDPDGVGYWLVAADGGIFAFDADFYGSTGSLKLNKPISGMVASPTGKGYLMVASDGGIFSFGDVPFHGSLGNTPPASPVVAVAAIGDPAPLSADGIYLVGIDIAPGTYRTTTSPTGCYWARLSGTGGALSDIIANEFGDGQQVVTIAPTDTAFKVDNCGPWTSEVVAKTAGDSFGNGVMVVGVDVLPGTYASAANSGCYWARLSGFDGSLDDIITNEFGDGQQVVTIASGDAGFKSSNCSDWHRIG
ncbi:MAG TPA: hypothetical protein VHL53_15725 [Acidimicrobiia bacterium]|nr:hypothetical protein [Acidimicrobiia bacterium]